MPTYEYACRACGHVFEIVQKMSDDPLVICPECGGELRKVFTPPAIAFKGSGFYATDHGRKAKPASPDGGGSKGEDGGTAEKKDAAAPTTKKDGTSSSGSSSSSSPSSSSGSKDGPSS